MEELSCGGAPDVLMTGGVRACSHRWQESLLPLRQQLPYLGMTQRGGSLTSWLQGSTAVNIVAVGTQRQEWQRVKTAHLSQLLREQSWQGLSATRWGGWSAQWGLLTYLRKKLIKWVWLAHRWQSSLVFGGGEVQPALWRSLQQERWEGWPAQPPSARPCRTSAAAGPSCSGPCLKPWSLSLPEEEQEDKNIKTALKTIKSKNFNGACTYLNCGFGHPSKSYEGFLLHAKASTQHAHVSEEDSYQQSDEQRCYSQTCRQRCNSQCWGQKMCLISIFFFQKFRQTTATSHRGAG